MAEEVKPPEPFERWLAIAQIGVVAFTLLGVLGFSVAHISVWPLAVTGLVTLVLLQVDEIASLTFKGLGVEAAITQAKQAEKDALRAAEKAKSMAAEAGKTNKEPRRKRTGYSSQTSSPAASGAVVDSAFPAFLHTSLSSLHHHVCLRYWQSSHPTRTLPPKASS